MAFRLKQDTLVAPDGQPGEPKMLPGGTPLDEIPESELRQLAPGHFESDSDDPDELPEDWRPEEQVAADVEHAERMRADADERAAAREAARAEGEAEG